MSEAKQAILERIRAAVAASPEDAYSNIPRNYYQASSLAPHRLIDLLAERLHDYGVVVYDCPETQIPDAIASALSAARKQSMLIAPGFPSEWLPSKFMFLQDTNLPYGALDASQGVLTTCAVAIAETGTIILRHTAEEGRRALTLIPDYHLCIIQAHQIVGSVVEGIRIAASFSNEPITTISGPSATSDIEMTRVKGVHGPRILDVIIVNSELRSS
jgi:L-lactate dehydrogenase complex protein LldG